ncbi:hypothetical protein, partial [uncultured Vibrio sp.]|uniref:hypothetical protein n=1 Tax=uncultured Vibrio sp. TaxID=114054 RepID=UPI00260985B7
VISHFQSTENRREQSNQKEEKNKDTGTVPKMNIKCHSACSVFERFAYSHTAPSGEDENSIKYEKAKQPFLGLLSDKALFSLIREDLFSFYGSRWLD